MFVFTTKGKIEKAGKSVGGLKGYLEADGMAKAGFDQMVNAVVGDQSIYEQNRKADAIVSTGVPGEFVDEALRAMRSRMNELRK